MPSGRSSGRNIRRSGWPLVPPRPSGDHADEMLGLSCRNWSDVAYRGERASWGSASERRRPRSPTGGSAPGPRWPGNGSQQHSRAEWGGYKRHPCHPHEERQARITDSSPTPANADAGRKTAARVGALTERYRRRRASTTERGSNVRSYSQERRLTRRDPSVRGGGKSASVSELGRSCRLAGHLSTGLEVVRARGADR